VGFPWVGEFVAIITPGPVTVDTCGFQMLVKILCRNFYVSHFHTVPINKGTGPFIVIRFPGLIPGKMDL
jgi:hypothetical protein